MDAKGLIDKIVKTEDQRRMKDLQCFMEELIGDHPEHLERLEEIAWGPHFSKETLEKSGVEIKYSPESIKKYMEAQGIKVSPDVTDHDIVYCVNYFYKTYYPLIPDLSMAARFTEKYLKSGHNPFLEWKWMCCPTEK